MINKFDEKILINVNREDDDLVSKVQTLNYTTGWTAPQGSDNSILCTTEYVKNNLAAVAHFSVEDPINPDTDPISTVWVKVTDTYPREVVDIFFWDSLTSKWDLATAYVAGYNYNGSLGLPVNLLSNTLVQVSELPVSDILQVGFIEYMYGTSFILKKDGTLWYSGYKGYYNLTPKVSTFTLYDSGPWEKIGNGYTGTHFIKKDGTLWYQGSNYSGASGLGTTTNVNSLTQISTETWKDVSDGGWSESMIAVRSDGTLWGAGDGQSYQLGARIPYTTSPSPMFQIGNDNDWSNCLAVKDGSYALKNDGSLWGSGYGVPLSSTTYAINGYFERISLGTYKKIVGNVAESMYAIGTDNKLYGIGYGVYKTGTTTTDEYSMTEIALPVGKGTLLDAWCQSEGSVAVKMSDGNIYFRGYAGTNVCYYDWTLLFNGLVHTGCYISYATIAW